MKKNIEQTKQETEELFKKLYSASSEEEQNKIANEIFEKNYNLVLNFANNFVKNCNVIEFDDAVQIASMAMWRSIFTCEIEKSAFSTYATGAMNFSIKDAVKRQSDNLVYKMMQAKKQLKKEGILEPTDEEIRTKMGVSRYLYLLASESQQTSLDIPVLNENTEKEVNLIDTIAADDKDVVDVAIYNQEREELERRIEKLSEREAYCLKRVIFEDATKLDIASELNLSRQAVTHIYNSAVTKILGVSVQSLRELPLEEQLEKFSTLSKGQREVMIKRCCEKKNTKETATELGITPANVFSYTATSLAIMTGMTRTRRIKDTSSDKKPSTKEK